MSSLGSVYCLSSICPDNFVDLLFWASTCELTGRLVFVAVVIVHLCILHGMVHLLTLICHGDHHLILGGIAYKRHKNYDNEE